ncbi:hypothetical protein LZP73_07835 [Shewanella sp. AS16]|uniref:hypothetical protein n=1 Tax=Shewanella sp. AS16 TaxID=2907625 RepID=UPI001F31D638|nr:hypothetical protein [Shewanella sp. AS16]MCE9686126.1 hypothetical protein [Shewanella sp. AS16]
MNKANLSLSLLCLSLSALLSLSAQAHDPKEHMKDGHKPNCAAMKGMDHSKMDMTDPLMQALMRKCTQQMHAEHAAAGDIREEQGQRQEQEETEPQPEPEHKH